VIKIIECPRDAMQGIRQFIPTETKISYMNQLLKVGFHTLDFGSFVSPKAIPQMRDTADVLSGLMLEKTNTELLAIVANVKGAELASDFSEIAYLGYPFSVSETFQLRNTNATLEQSIHRVEQIQSICIRRNMDLVTYLSMGFGNPYGDPWNVDIVQSWVDRLSTMGIKTIALSDTIGVASPESITYLFSNLIPAYDKIEFGAHFHTTPESWFEKINAAYIHGCRRFDTAIRGYGGCPMAKDDLTGNMPTENVISYFQGKNVELNLDMRAFNRSVNMTTEIFIE
jgi:hydroxymethylglutaryl-CoA lyase